MSTPSALKYLTGSRHLSLEVIETYKLGFNGERFVIPIPNEFGLIVNAKLYDPNPKGSMPKMLNYSLPDAEEPRKFGSPPTLFPFSVIQTMQDSVSDELTLMIVEGEWDALALLSVGVPSITSTAGAKSWPLGVEDRFTGLHACICYDNDEEGERCYRKPLAAIRKNVRSCKRLKVPRKWGKDATDWIRNQPSMRKREAWNKRINSAKSILENPDSALPTDEVVELTLQDSSLAKWYKKPMRVKALVTGKDSSPYFVPKQYRVACSHSCGLCPLKELGQEYRTCKIAPDDPIVLKLIDIPEERQAKLLLNHAGFGHAKPECQVKLEVIETQNIERLLVIPTLDSSNGEYSIRSVYYSGHGISSNRSYSFTGRSMSHPKDQHSTCLFDSAMPVQDAIDTFELTPELFADLKRFRPKKEDLLDHLFEIAEWQSTHITHIKRRPDLHIAVDLVFHSVSAFEFNGEPVKRGMLDVLILGDTRCGKGYVSEGLVKYYGLGEIASGENCSFAGLVGGVQQAGNRWLVTWGIIPLNNNRLVVIDEASALSRQEIGRMSRVRSEGVAEIVKIVREATQANTRLLWCANPRSGQPLATYGSGAEAIKELVGSNEDISRFDYALTVASSEVPSSVINVIRSPDDTEYIEPDQFNRSLCKSLVLWAWSRSPEQVKFTPSATKSIIESAIALGASYSATIPLVQSENIRVKLAKISAAVAARTFSSDKTGERLIVTSRHVRCACQILDLFYTKESMRYHEYSDAAYEASTMGDTAHIVDTFDSLGKDKTHLIDGMLALQDVTIDAIADYVGDTFAARAIISELVKAKCLMRQERNLYRKNPAFVEWLRNEKEALNAL